MNKKTYSSFKRKHFSRRIREKQIISPKKRGKIQAKIALEKFDQQLKVKQ